VRSAVESGAIALNYAEAENLVLSDDAVEAVRVRDHLTGDVAEVRARTVLNAAGPWSPRLVGDIDRERRALGGTFSRDACFVVKRRFPHSYAVALQGKTRDPDAL